jgi:hypothetical protein
MVITQEFDLYELFIHRNQLTWHHHFATNFMIQQIISLFYIYLNTNISLLFIFKYIYIIVNFIKFNVHELDKVEFTI